MVTTHNTPVPWAPTFFELSGEFISPETHGGQHSWYVRAQNFVTVTTWAAASEELPPFEEPDESIVIVPDGSAIDVAGPSGAVSADGPAVVIVPAGAHAITVRRPGYLLRVHTTRGEIAAKAGNDAYYVSPNPVVAPLPPRIDEVGVLRVHPLADVPSDPKRFGRIFQTRELMINWFPTQEGPRDTDALSPHAHDDFEQASVTLQGEYVHHIRRPWTKRMRDWRPDEHVQVMSPSVTIIPPGNVHTTRAVGHGDHILIDVFAPPREDFIANGWVLNSADADALRG